VNKVFPALTMAFLLLAQPALADKYSDTIISVRETVNEVGDRACAGTGSALSRLFYYSEGKDRALAGHAYVNLAWMIGPEEPCAKAGYKHNLKKWQSYLERAAELEWPPTLSYYGGILMDGEHGIEPNGRRALKFLQQAEAAGSSTAAARLAKGFYEGTLPSGRNLEKAQKWLEIAYSRNPSQPALKILDKYKPLIASGMAEHAAQAASPGQGASKSAQNQQTTSTGTVQKASNSGPSLAETEHFLKKVIDLSYRHVREPHVTVEISNGTIQRYIRGKKGYIYRLEEVSIIEVKDSEDSEYPKVKLYCRNGSFCFENKNEKVKADGMTITFSKKPSNNAHKLARQTANALKHYASFFGIRLEEISSTHIENLGSAFD
jgi:TPR repeat protein